MKLNKVHFKAGILLLLFNVLFVCNNNYAKEYYVRSASEITAAMLTAQPGDTLKMATGVWTNQKVIFKGNGNSSLPIYLIAESPGNVILSGTSSLRIGGNYLVVDGLSFKNGYSSSGGVIEFKDDTGKESNYCRLTNTSIADYNPSSTTADYKWISLYGTHNRVDHCYLKGKTHIGTTLVVWRSTTRADYHLIDSNYFGERPVFPENGAETIRVGTSDQSLSSSFTIVEYNYFEKCNGEIEIISNKSCDNIYRYNTFKDCEGTLTLRHGNKCIVEGNFFLCGNQPNSGGVRIIGEDHKVLNNYIENSYGESFKSAITIMNGVPNSPLNRYFQVKRALVAFNTVVNSRVTLHLGAGKDSELTLPPLDCKIVNNIYYSNQSPLVTFSDNPINLTWSGNIFYGAAIGMALPVNNYNDNPQLIKSSDNLYRLTPTSPAINRSDTLFKPTNIDMDGQQRLGIYDAGADEHSQQPVIIKPLTKDVIGPKWMSNPSGVSDDPQNPQGFYLEQNFPNPFNPLTKIKYSLNTIRKISLRVIDVLGEVVQQIVNEEQPSGNYAYNFVASTLTSGIYFFELSDGEKRIVKKGILLK